MNKRGVKVFELSGATGEGAQAVLDACARVLFANEDHKVRLKGRLVKPSAEPETTTAKASRPRRAKPAAKVVAKKPAAKVAAKKPAAKSAKKKPQTMQATLAQLRKDNRERLRQIDEKELRALKHDKKKLVRRKR